MNNDTTTNAVTIFQPENIRQIVALGPTALTENAESRDRCTRVGTELLRRVESEGMSDSLDREIASYIEKSRVTVTKLNRKRAPVTKLFDEIRAVFTAIEADVDPKKSASIPGQLQQHRDKYAAVKRAEAEARHREEARRIAADLARQRYRTELEESYRSALNAHIVASINTLAEYESTITLGNFDEVSDRIKNFPATLADGWLDSVTPGVRMPVELTPEESRAISADLRKALAPLFAENYQFDIEPTRDEILLRLPSKRAELERAAAAGAEEAARIKAAMEELERAEALRRQEERRDKEAAAKAQAEIAAKKTELDGLFGIAQAQKAEYQPKTSVRKRIVPRDPAAFMAIVGYWWSREGQSLSVEELGKIFKRMVTFCEKAANDKDNPVFLNDEHLAYEDEVKAK